MDPKQRQEHAIRQGIEPGDDPNYKAALERLKSLLQDEAELSPLSLALGRSSRYLSNLFSEEGTLALHQLLKLSQLTGIPSAVFLENMGPKRAWLPEQLLHRERERGAKTAQDSPFLTELAPRLERLKAAQVEPAVPGRRSTVLDALEDERFRNRQGAMKKTEALVEEITVDLESRATKGKLPGPRLGELSAAIALWATIQRTLGLRNLAINAFQLSFPLARQSQDAWANGTNHQRAAHVLRDFNRADLALDFISEALWRFEAIDSSVDRWRCFVDRGAFCGHQMAYADSDASYKTALEFLPKSEWRHRAAAFQGLANNAHFRGFCGEAKTLAELGISECLEDNNILAYLKWRHAVVLFELKQIPAAKASFLESLSLMGQFGSAGEVALLVLDYAEVLTSVGCFADGIELASNVTRWLPNYRSNPILHRAMSELLDVIRLGKLSLAKVNETRERIKKAGPQPSLLTT